MTPYHDSESLWVAEAEFLENVEAQSSVLSIRILIQIMTMMLFQDRMKIRAEIQFILMNLFLLKLTNKLFDRMRKLRPEHNPNFPLNYLFFSN